MQVEIYQDKHGDWRWRKVARNGKIVADSAEGYGRKGRARVAAFRFAGDTEYRHRWSWYVAGLATGLVLALVIWGVAAANNDQEPPPTSSATDSPVIQPSMQNTAGQGDTANPQVAPPVQGK